MRFFMESQMRPMHRNRWKYAGLVMLTILVGLASRHFADYLPPWLNLYLGDALWALMVYWGFAWLFPKLASWKVALLALAFSFAIEFSQLSQASWLMALRKNRLGGLVLGYGFLWSDLLAYSLGVACGYLAERLLLHRP